MPTRGASRGGLSGQLSMNDDLVNQLMGSAAGPTKSFSVEQFAEMFKPPASGAAAGGATTASAAASSPRSRARRGSANATTSSGSGKTSEEIWKNIQLSGADSLQGPPSILPTPQGSGALGTRNAARLVEGVRQFHDSDATGKYTASFNNFRRHNPLGRALSQPRPRKDIQALVSRPQILAAFFVLGNLTEGSHQNRLVHLTVITWAVVTSQSHLMTYGLDLPMELSPLAHTEGIYKPLAQHRLPTVVRQLSALLFDPTPKV